MTQVSSLSLAVVVLIVVRSTWNVCAVMPYAFSTTLMAKKIYYYIKSKMNNEAKITDDEIT